MGTLVFALSTVRSIGNTAIRQCSRSINDRIRRTEFGTLPGFTRMSYPSRGAARTVVTRSGWNRSRPGRRPTRTGPGRRRGRSDDVHPGWGPPRAAGVGRPAVEIWPFAKGGVATPVAGFVGTPSAGDRDRPSRHVPATLQPVSGTWYRPRPGADRPATSRRVREDGALPEVSASGRGRMAEAGREVSARTAPEPGRPAAPSRRRFTARGQHRLRSRAAPDRPPGLGHRRLGRPRARPDLLTPEM